MDALFLNDDRHLNNTAVLERSGKYDYCPIFDNGAGLLSNVQMSHIDRDPKALIAAQRARPFNTIFNRQVGAVHSLYDHQLYMPKLTRDEISTDLALLLTCYAARDGALSRIVCAKRYL